MATKDFDPKALELAGLLQKRGSSALSRWKQRWFYIEKDRINYSHNREEDEPVGYIPIQKINFVYNSSDIPSAPAKTQGCGFVIDTGKKSYYLIAGSRQEMWSWVDNLEKLRKYWSQVSTQERPTAKLVSLKTSSDGKVHHPNRIEGYLLKKGPSNLTGFKQRYFVLEDETLTYFKTNEDTEHILQIHLDNINYVTPTNNIPSLPKKNYGMAFLVDSENHILYLVAPSKDNMWIWVNGITAAKKKLRTKKGPGSAVRGSFSVSAKKTPRKNFDKVAQMVMSSDRLLMGALCEVVRDQLPTAAAIYSLYLCQGKMHDLLKWAPIHRIACADTKKDLQLWEPMKERVTIAVITRYICEFETELVARFATLVSHALDELGEAKPERKSIIKLLIDLMLHSWNRLTWGLQQTMTQYRISLSLKFIINEHEAYATTLIYLLHILLAPTYPTFNFLDEQERVTMSIGSQLSGSIKSSGYLTPCFETIAAYLIPESEEMHLDLYPIVLEVVRESQELILKTTSITSSIQNERRSSIVTGLDEIEKQALAFLHHQLSINVDVLGDFITRKKDLYDFIDVEIEHVQKYKEEEVVIVQKQHQEILEEIEYEVLVNPSVDLSSTVEKFSDITSGSVPTKNTELESQASKDNIICLRPGCRCHNYEPHPIIVEKCDNCFHTKSEHESKAHPTTAPSSTNEGKASDQLPQRIHDVHEETTEQVLSIDFHEESDEIEEDGADEPRKLENPFKEAFTLVDQLFIVLALCDVDWLRERNYGQLVKILGSANFATVAALYQVTKDTDRVAKAIVSLFEASGLSLTLLKWALTREIENTATDSILFRTDSLATKLWKAYTSTVGLNYIRSTLKVCITDLLGNPSGHEVDPNRLSAGETASQNMQRLIQTCERFYGAFRDSIESCPLHLLHEVRQKFPGSEYPAVGGFMFLRYFCGGIMTPEKYGIYEGDISPEGRRALILVAKILQNLNNCVEFDGVKESFMMDANSFITAKLQDLKSVYDSFVNVGDDGRVPLAVPSRATFVLAQLDLEFLHNEMTSHLDEISAQLASIVAYKPHQHVQHKKVRIRTTRKIKTITKLETTRRVTHILKPIARLDPAQPTNPKTERAESTERPLSNDDNSNTAIHDSPQSNEPETPNTLSQSTETGVSNQNPTHESAEMDVVGTNEPSPEENLTATTTTTTTTTEDHVSSDDPLGISITAEYTVEQLIQDQPSDGTTPNEPSNQATDPNEIDSQATPKDSAAEQQTLSNTNTNHPHAEQFESSAPIPHPSDSKSKLPPGQSMRPVLPKLSSSPLLSNRATNPDPRMRSVSRISVVRKGLEPSPRAQSSAFALSQTQYERYGSSNSPSQSYSGNTADPSQFNPFQQKPSVSREKFGKCHAPGCACPDPELHVWMRTKCKNCFHEMRFHEIGFVPAAHEASPQE